MCLKLPVLWIVSIAVLLLLTSTYLPAAERLPSDPFLERKMVFPSYTAFRDALTTIERIDAGPERERSVDRLWSSLLEANQVPFVAGDSVAFLYRGEGSDITWKGDWNGWGKGEGPSQGTRLGDTDIWILEMTFPRDARLDYKIVRNGNDWILDKNNPLRQWGGFGPNSELRMPDYSYPMETVRDSTLPAGLLGPAMVTQSVSLGYAVNYRVYTPAGQDRLTDLPSIYVTDGHEYTADHLGSMVIVLDNLIANGKLEPLIAVFIDPREVGNANHNRRSEQYLGNESFLSFVAEELVPSIDARYKTDTRADRRAILGTSYGGLNAAIFAVKRPDLFGNALIQSPAFSGWRRVYDLYNDAPRLPIRIAMSNGRLGDGESANKMRAILDGKDYGFYYTERNEGHSWGQWRALLGEMLCYLFGTGNGMTSERDL